MLSPNPSGKPNDMEFDGLSHTTVKGKVVYNRKKHEFKINDIRRIIEKVELTDIQIVELIRFIGDLTFLDDVQEELLNTFLNILSTIFPAWFVNMVEWIYDHVDAGIPPWIPPDIAEEVLNG